MQKIVLMLRVKDGLFFVKDWLANMEKLVDEIVVVDNGSKDGTYEVLNSHHKVVEIEKTEGFDESRDKNLLYAMARKRNPDWLLWLDIDEIFEEAFKREDLLRLISNKKVNRYVFRRFHLVNKNKYNADWDWIKYTSMPDRVLWREQTSGYFENIKFNNPPVKGISGPIRISHYRLKHLGYINPKEVDKKIGIYRKVDPELEDVYQSMIFKNPRTFKWSERKGFFSRGPNIFDLILDIIFLSLFTFKKIKKLATVNSSIEGR